MRPQGLREGRLAVNSTTWPGNGFVSCRPHNHTYPYMRAKELCESRATAISNSFPRLRPTSANWDPDWSAARGYKQPRQEVLFGKGTKLTPTPKCWRKPYLACRRKRQRVRDVPRCNLVAGQIKSSAASSRGCGDQARQPQYQAAQCRVGWRESG